MTSSAERAAARLAKSRHGLVTVDRLRELGMTPKAIRVRIERGQWSKVDEGVLRISGTPVTWESKVLARVLAAGSGAVASHRTAAALLGLEGSERGEPEITVPRGRRYRRTGVRTHESTDLHLVQPVMRYGIPTTPVTRTLLDLGGMVPRRAVQLALDDARRRHQITWPELLDTLVAHARRGRPGVQVLRSILDENFDEVAATDSGFERLVLTLLVESGLSHPVLQHEVVCGGNRYRLDLAYPDPLVGIELDGSIHLRRDVWEADHVRQNALILAGWTLLRFTWRHYRDRPKQLISEVRAALRSR